MRNPTNKKNSLKLLVANIMILTLLFFGFYLMKGNNQIATVQTIALNVRQEPTVNSPILSQVHREDRITIQDKKNNWYKIQLPDKTTGWVADWLIFEGESGPYTSLPGILIKSDVELKKSPSEKSKTLDTLKRKTHITVNLELNGWSRVLVNDEIGWIPSDTFNIKKKDFPKWKEETPIFIATETASLYEKPEQKSAVKTALAYADTLVAMEKLEDEWYKVKTKDGQTGYLKQWQITEHKLTKDDKKPDTPLAEYVVMIDPGHGGNDPGASSNDGKYFEKDMTLATAETIKNELNKHGMSVLLTRSKDEIVPLKNISAKSNESHADAFISLHYDSTENPNEGSGTTTYYRHKSGKPLAKAVNDQIAGRLPLPNRGYSNQDYLVLRENEKPAILIELGYMNNDLDAKYARSKDYHKRVAESIYNGLLEYFEIK